MEIVNKSSIVPLGSNNINAKANNSGFDNLLFEHQPAQRISSQTKNIPFVDAHFKRDIEKDSKVSQASSPQPEALAESRSESLKIVHATNRALSQYLLKFDNQYTNSDSKLQTKIAASKYTDDLIQDPLNPALSPEAIELNSFNESEDLSQTKSQNLNQESVLKSSYLISTVNEGNLHFDYDAIANLDISIHILASQHIVLDTEVDRAIEVSVLWGGKGNGYLSYSLYSKVVLNEKPRLLEKHPYSQISQLDNTKTFTDFKSTSLTTFKVEREIVTSSIKTVLSNTKPSDSVEKRVSLSTGTLYEQQFKVILPQFLRTIINDEKELKIFVRDYFQTSKAVQKKLNEWLYSNEFNASKKVQIHFNGNEINAQGGNYAY